MKFSVMAPVYNVEKYLKDCVDSVLSQSCGDFELILADDGSTDGSGRLCDEYAGRDSRIKVFHKPNGGLLQTRSFALERASGDYCVFLDSDDYLAPGALETMERYIDETGCDCLVFGISRMRDGEAFSLIGCHEAYAGRVLRDKREICNVVLNHSAFNSVCRKCVRRACFDGRDYSPFYGVANGEDLIRSLEILENTESFLFVGDALYCYRVNEQSITRSVDYDGRGADSTVQRAVLAFLRRTDIFAPEDYDRLRNHYLDELVIELRRIARRCSSEEQAVAAMDRLWHDALYQDFLSPGYRRVPAFPGQARPKVYNLALYHMTIALFRECRFREIVALDRLLGGRKRG